MTIDRRAFVAGLPPALFAARAARAEPGVAGAAGDAEGPWPERLVASAESQVGVTTVYDPAYVRIAYPGGDVPADRGVCTDVIVRAYRAAFGVDLQQLVHLDMIGAFSAYPTTWGARRADTNIDHRRVPNLETFLRRRGAELAVSKVGSDYSAGEIITQRLPGALPHIAIVTARPSEDGARPLLVHNIGAGTKIEDTLFAFEIAGRFRFPPPA